eukprot:scaffold26606_cov124-Isochrysis_galbana.AAC.3
MVLVEPILYVFVCGCYTGCQVHPQGTPRVPPGHSRTPVQREGGKERRARRQGKVTGVRGRCATSHGQDSTYYPRGPQAHPPLRGRGGPTPEPGGRRSSK